MSKYEYIDKCVELLQSVNANELSVRALGTYLGKGSSVKTFALGQTSVGDQSLHIAVKTGIRSTKNMGERRLPRELGIASLLIEKVPSLINTLPAFAGELRCTHVSVLITEDVSANGTYTVYGQYPPNSIIRDLRDGFDEANSITSVFDDEELYRSVFFTANNKLRILDLTPGPFTHSYVRESTDLLRHTEYVRDLQSIGKLTLEMADESIFAQSIRSS